MSGIEPQPEMTRQDKLTAKRYNEIAKFPASVLNSVALAIFGLGFLRAVFDPGATWLGGATIGFAIVAPPGTGTRCDLFDPEREIGELRMEAIDPYVAFSLGALAFGLVLLVAMHFYSRRVDRQLERRDR